MLGDCMRKSIPDLDQHASKLCTSLDAIRDAYAAARDAASSVQGPCHLITSKGDPVINRRGCYTVTTTPCGYSAIVNNEQV